jgi:L-ascorbate metabolism protein UlaG (beta-lactamase superfamily)
VRTLDAATLERAPDGALFRLGHSTVLIKLDGGWWLTDPVFAERASPFSFAGPKRFHAPPLAIDELPPLRAVILSHDHYDHLDHDAILRLAPKAELFLAPLGVGDRLVRWGIDAGKVRQFDWWQETQLGGVRLAAVPAQHFSGRGLGDGDRSLWVSWVIDAADLRLFFSGDTGYHAGFGEIGERYGPFDLTMLETGGYDPQWADVHMQPEQTLQAHLDLRGKWLMPIHNGTFDLAFHPWYEPLERIAALAGERRGRLLPVNVTGAIAAIASDMGFRWEMTKSFALIGRTLGALGHIQEEMERPMVERIKETIAERVQYADDDEQPEQDERESEKNEA